MCKAFSCIATRKRKVYWKLGMDGHEDIKTHFKLDDTKLGLVPIEISPKGYLNMSEPKQDNKDWTFKFDESCPDWWSDSYERMCWNSCKEWYSKVIKLVNWKEARRPIHPFKLKMVSKVTIKQKILLKKWDSVRDSVWDSVRGSVWGSVGGSVWDSVWDSVGDSVGGSVGGSVWGYIGDLFYLKRTQWKYTEKIKTKGYPFQCVVDLWKQGLVPSFDGTDYRLHSGKKAKVVFKISKTELIKIN